MLLQRLTRYSTFLAALGTGACASHHTTRVPNAIQQPSSPEIIQDSVPDVAVLHIYDIGQLQYNYRTQSIITTVAGDSGQRTDTISVTADVGINITSLGNQVIHASVKTDSLIVSRPGSKSDSRRLPSESRGFTITTTNSGLQMVASDHIEQASCADTTTNWPIHADLLPNVPISHNVRTWADTSSLHECRMGVPLVVNRVMKYRFEDSGQVPYQLVRETEITFGGIGLLLAQEVKISGEGISTDTLHLSGIPLRLEQLSGQSQIEIEFQSKYHHQRFTQISNRIAKLGR